VYDATMLEDGDAIHIGICHSDGSASMDRETGVDS